MKCNSRFPPHLHQPSSFFPILQLFSIFSIEDRQNFLLPQFCFDHSLLPRSQAPRTILTTDSPVRRISHFKDGRTGTTQLSTWSGLYRVSEIPLKHSSVGFLSSRVHPGYLLLMSIIVLPLPAASMSNHSVKNEWVNGWHKDKCNFLSCVLR